MPHPATTGLLNLWLRSPKKAMRGFGDPTTPDEINRYNECLFAQGTWDDATKTCKLPDNTPATFTTNSGWAYAIEGVAALAIIGGFAWYVSKHNG